MRRASLIAMALVAVLAAGCEDRHNGDDAAVQAVQNLHPLQTRPGSKTKAFDEALGNDGSTVVRSLEECEESFDAQTCADRDAEAHAEHLSKAPRFDDRETCEAFYGAGRCEEVAAAPTSSPARYKRFVPAMQGYVIGRAQSRPVPIYFGRPTPARAPAPSRSLLPDRQMASRTAPAARIVSAQAPAQSAPPRPAPRPAPTQIARISPPTPVARPSIARPVAASPVPKVRPRR